MPPTPRPTPVQLRIELLEVCPLIWRRVIVSNQWTLASLHGYLQWVMGWQDSHAHEFHVGDLIVAPTWWIAEIALDADTASYRDERRCSVAWLVKELGVRGELEYHYDMGDGWRHRIVIEAAPTAPHEREWPLPTCVAGENARPPEDVGGPPGYSEFLRILGDSADEQHADMWQWIGGVFDPKGFDLNRLNRDGRVAKRRR